MRDGVVFARSRYLTKRLGKSIASMYLKRSHAHRAGDGFATRQAFDKIAWQINRPGVSEKSDSFFCDGIDRQDFGHYNVLVSDTSALWREYNVVFSKRNDSKKEKREVL